MGVVVFGISPCTVSHDFCDSGFTFFDCGMVGFGDASPPCNTLGGVFPNHLGVEVGRKDGGRCPLSVLTVMACCAWTDAYV